MHPVIFFNVVVALVKQECVSVRKVEQFGSRVKSSQKKGAANVIKQFIFMGVLSLVIALVHGTIGGFEMPEEAATTVPENVLKNLPKKDPEPISSTPSTKPTSSTPSTTAATDSDFTIELFHQLWESNSAIFLDARTREEFEASHVPGSFHLPLESFNGSIPELLQAMPLDQVFVIYCGGGDCHASHAVGAQMKGFGYENALVYELGFPSWEEAGHPVEKGYFQ